MDFSVVIRMTEADYLLFNKTVLKANVGTRILQGFLVIAAVIIDVNLMLDLWHFFGLKEDVNLWISVLSAVLVNFLAFFFRDWYAKIVFKENTPLHDLRKEIHFTEEMVEIHDLANKQEMTSRTRYDGFDRLIESKTFFFLMYNKYTGEPIPKENMTESQMIFLRKKFYGRIVHMK